ncbi:MAG: hypothetical protein ACOYL6_11360 [Bacteriovoracaceae bacterium]
MKNFLFLFFITTSSWAYEPLAKLECKKRLSATEFLYYEISPIGLSGHQGHLEFFINNELAFKNDTYLNLNEENVNLSFDSDTISAVFEIDRVAAKDGDSFKGFVYMATLGLPYKEAILDCDYFVDFDGGRKTR